MYRQVSWLAALALPVRLPDPAGQQARNGLSGIVGEARRLQLRGQPRHGTECDPNRVPYSPAVQVRTAGTDTRSTCSGDGDLVKHHRPLRMLCGWPGVADYPRMRSSDDVKGCELFVSQSE